MLYPLLPTPRINLRGPRFIVPYVRIVRTHTGTLWPLKHYNGIAVSVPPRPSALWDKALKGSRMLDPSSELVSWLAVPRDIKRLELRG